MRVNVKRIAVVAAAGVLLWLVYTLFSHIQVQREPVSDDGDRSSLEKRLDLLESALHGELRENKLLLQLLREKLEQREQEALDAKKEPVSGPTVLPVLVMACDRVTVRRCLDKLVQYRPDVDTFPIIVSQDCDDRKTYDVIMSYVTPDSGITVVRQPDQAPISLPRNKMKFQGYYKIARHYKFALTHVLDELRYESVIIVEDDLDISEDFFEYFLGTYPLLQMDPSLWCISAWNDNGKKGLIDPSRPELLHRTDFFPGLGWLLPARVWRELSVKWPSAFFDDWLREPAQTQGRSCIRPEIPRTSTFGKEGVSKGLFFDLHLRFIQLSEQYVPFTQLDLTYLLKENYDRQLEHSMALATNHTLEEVVSVSGETHPAKILYSDRLQFKRAARALGLMDDFRSGVPRTAYRGVVSCFYRGRRVYLAPSAPFIKYDTSWS